MGCRFLKSCEMFKDKNIVEIYVPGYNIIEPIENKENIENKAENDLSNINPDHSNDVSNHININVCNGASQNLNLSQDNNINRNLSANSINLDISNINNSHLNQNTILINQSGLLDKSDTRGKSFNKTFALCTTRNMSFYNAFSIEMLKEINLIRLNPIFYADKIRDFMKFIKTDKNTNRKYFLVNKNTKINLLKGEVAFLDCLDFIKDFDMKIKETNKILNELELKEELKFPFPLDNPELCINKDYIKESLLKLKSSIKGNFKLKGFHYDLSTNDPEISTILQIVDDNNSGCKRRNMLLDESIKYIGVNIGKLKDNLYCIYLVFAA